MKLSSTCSCGASFSLETPDTVDYAISSRADLAAWRKEHHCAPAAGRGNGLAATQIGFRMRNWDRIENAR